MPRTSTWETCKWNLVKAFWIFQMATRVTGEKEKLTLCWAQCRPGSCVLWMWQSGRAFDGTGAQPGGRGPHMLRVSRQPNCVDEQVRCRRNLHGVGTDGHNAKHASVGSSLHSILVLSSVFYLLLFTLFSRYSTLKKPTNYVFRNPFFFWQINKLYIFINQGLFSYRVWQKSLRVNTLKGCYYIF